jgi:multidrug efflux pump subunit AcrA (membrane-fusion protein)
MVHGTSERASNISQISILGHCKMNSFFGGIVLSLLLGLVATPVAAQSEPAAGAQIVTVQQSRVSSSVALGGTVVAYREVTLTAQIPGRIEFLAGTEGDRFN